MKTMILILFPVLLLAQEFMIQPDGREPVVDPFTGDIYCRVFGEGIVKIRADGSGKVVNPYPHIALPVFAHKTHKAFYVVWTDNNDSTEIYTIDFNKDSIFISKKIPWSSIVGISPNDKYIYLDAMEGETDWYYSLEKDSIYSTQMALPSFRIVDWIDDSTIVFSTGENFIIRFCFTQGTLDTLIRLETGKYITGIAVNREKEFIAYGFADYYDSILVKFFYPHNSIDSTIFNFKWINASGGPLNYIYLTWDSTFTKLAFLGDYGWALTASDIFIHDISQRKTFMYSDAHYGYKYNLNWLNEDTLIYENANGSGVFGFALQDTLYEIPVGIHHSTQPILPTAFQLNVYPNPFNSYTTIEIEGVQSGHIILSIFDLTGRLVFEQTIRREQSSTVKFLWNGIGKNGKPLASGIYYAIVRNITPRSIFKTIPHKLVLVK